MIFRLYDVHNEHKMIKIDNQTREKSQVVLSKVLDNFAADCNYSVLCRTSSTQYRYRVIHNNVVLFRNLFISGLLCQVHKSDLYVRCQLNGQKIMTPEVFIS